MLAAPRGFEPRFTDPKSAVLPLDEGAAGPSGQECGAEDGTRTRDPHLGKVMLYQLSHFRSMSRPPYGGAESQNRTGDTAIFSRVLYQLSYLGPMANQALAARRRREDYHAPRSASKPGTGPGRPSLIVCTGGLWTGGSGPEASESAVSGRIWNRPCSKGMRTAIAHVLAAPIPPDRPGTNTPHHAARRPGAGP